MKFIRKVGRRRANEEQKERRDTTSEDDDDDNKATKFFFFSLHFDGRSVVSRATSHRMQIVITLETCMHYRTPPSPFDHFLNATHVTNIGFYLCVFLDTTDRTRMPFAWHVNMNMFASTQIAGFSFRSLSLARTFFPTFARAFLATHLLIRLFALGCLLFRKLVCTHGLSHSYSLARWFVAFAHRFAISNLFYPHLQSNLWLNTSVSFPLTLSVALCGGSNKSTIQLFDLCVLSPFIFLSLLAGIWGLTLSDATCDDNITMMRFVQQRKTQK